jgi:anti-anti-sigma factor
LIKRKIHLPSAPPLIRGLGGNQKFGNLHHKKGEKTMALDITLDIQNDVAKITLVGELDGSNAADFKAKIEEAAAAEAKKLVLFMSELDFMASAGLRVLVFSKQKMGSGVDIYVIGAQEMILETIEKTGLNHTVIIQEEYQD